MTHAVSADVPARLRDGRRVLVLQPDNIGDVVMTGPARWAIKALLPDAHLTVRKSGRSAGRCAVTVDR